MRFMVSCSDKFYKILKLSADASCMNVSEFIRFCVTLYLQNNERIINVVNCNLKRGE